MTRVRELRPADEPAWRRLWAGYLEFYERPLPEEVTALTFARVSEARDGFVGRVAVGGDDAPVGFVHLHFHPSTWSASGYCYLEDLFVDPAARRGGVGRALIDATYALADERGCSRVYWHTDEGNARARALYDQVARFSGFIRYDR